MKLNALYIKAFMLKCYFECLCEPRDSIVAFSDFLYLEVADNALLPPSIPLAPMRLFLMVTELMKSIRRMDVEELLGIINSSACHEFRARYQEIVSVVRSEISESPNVDGLLRLPYARAVEWCNVSSKTILRLCHMAGSDAMNRRRNWTLGALLDDTAARGFVDYAKRTAAFARVQQKLLQEKWEIMPLTSQHTNVQIVIMRDINKANVVIMGPDAHGNVVNQSVVQDQHDINLTMLAEELAQLRLAMKREATTSEHDTAIERIASAETEAKTGNLEKTVGFLKLAGQWALDQAIKNGAAAATAALQKALG